MSVRWSLQLRREAASVPFARRVLLGAMEAAGVDPDISHDLSVALSEACANAVEHAEGDLSGTYRVTAEIDGDRCRIEVTDFGPGLPSWWLPHRTRVPAAAAVPAESGRGMFLIESLVDNVCFDSRPGRGVVVSFDKALKWREGSLLQAS
ncbi:hypothetical protein GCM10010406_10900 [Streptomyces thermolineatus]|uniref:Histidine kinase/HSP90-like ATPase domain-containing protein n=1 Tax=Streptomyces thermolineatus TaxID=44033 RepID=A0ABN3L528_9ACTN